MILHTLTRTCRKPKEPSAQELILEPAKLGKILQSLALKDSTKVYLEKKMGSEDYSDRCRAKSRFATDARTDYERLRCCKTKVMMIGDTRGRGWLYGQYQIYVDYESFEQVL